MINYFKLLIKVFIFFFLPLVLIYSPKPLNAQDGQLIVPADSWPPFRIMNKNGNTGIDFDLLAELSKRLNIDINIKNYPWSRSLQSMKDGKVDMMTGVAKREERAEYMYYVTPNYYTCSTVFYVKKGDSQIIKEYDDLKNYLVGVVDNSAYFAPFDTDKSLNKRVVTNEKQLIQMLSVDRVKVIVGTDCQVDYDIARMGLNNSIEKAVYKPNNNVDLYITISKKSEFVKDIDKISQTLKDILEEGKIKEFAKKYYE